MLKEVDKEQRLHEYGVSVANAAERKSRAERAHSFPRRACMQRIGKDYAHQ